MTSPQIEYTKEPKVAQWISTIEKSGSTIGEITPLALNYKPNGELLFAYLEAKVTAPEGYKIPSLIFLRGHAVLVVLVVKNRQSGEERFVMVEQRRIATGEISLEFPAGMLDNDIDNPGYVAVKELGEETGLSITQEQLIPLTDTLLYSTPGACDEGLYFYTATVELADKEYQALHGQLRVNESENERIRVVLATEQEFRERNRSIQALAAYFLYKENLQESE